MNASPGFVFKVFGLSAAIAFAIKFLAPKLEIPATASVSLLMVLLPVIAMAGLLAWQLKRPGTPGSN
ncbi:hypothetical protein [Pseudanabaena sp. FACHB-2040]|uniref:hypothetical protein n=1 Tax=Pseudanabaena sp. FACHB-2040 TaxID=2692859 RepID=UPI001686841A|nr:hypothetical protein [Pseudanabaena sp. FACHB-2040]MBD0266773.1 hypothetical protein [Cyanobacteria bacterium Co-bin8]MBD2258852.1 hypothetical protein [Pseudanabaena sp. FACHB-2040]